jgi:RNA polymerase sigma-70 factor, ECF subfamily
MPGRSQRGGRGSSGAAAAQLTHTVAIADETLEEAHRLYFGRLVGWLFRYSGDLQLAEDAVASAFASAVTSWRASGVPHSPEAWLRVTARNAAVSAVRAASRTRAVAPEAFAELEAQTARATALDERLGLLFVCAHPAIDSRMHAPLMLQAVLGVDAARIASAFLVPPTTMGQRLSRAKAKIRDAGIRYREPEPAELPGRLAPVLQAVYAAYGMGDPTASESDGRDDELRHEAIRLARVLVHELPDQAESLGLLALLLHTESRRAGRVVEGVFVPLAEQDVSLWSAELRREADELLARASSHGMLGRFQLEAAISSAHSARADGHPTDWAAVVTLYTGLLAVAGSIGATVGAASAIVEAGDPHRALGLLDDLPADAVRDYQPYWVCRARVLGALGDADATAARARSIGLTTNPAVRAYLLEG